MSKKVLFLSIARIDALGKTDINLRRFESSGFYMRLDGDFLKDEKRILAFVLGFNGVQGSSDLEKYIELQLPALFNENGQPIIELKKHNVTSFDPESDARRMSLPNFIYFLEEVNKIEIVGDSMIFKDAPSANHKERFDYCLENAVTDC